MDGSGVIMFVNIIPTWLDFFFMTVPLFSWYTFWPTIPHPLAYLMLFMIVSVCCCFFVPVHLLIFLSALS